MTSILTRIDEATRRIVGGLAPQRIPADPDGDADLVLSEARALLVEWHAALDAAERFIRGTLRNQLGWTDADMNATTACPALTAVRRALDKVRPALPASPEGTKGGGA